jgi:hypothetical protein
MEPALARHDSLTHATLEARGAFVFKTVSDEFCAAFATAPAAIAAALEAQRALAAADFASVDGLRVRMALHTVPPNATATTSVQRLIALRGC